MPEYKNYGIPATQIKFSKRECRICDMQPHWLWTTPPRRTITVYPETQRTALIIACARQPMDVFAGQYARRAGVEGAVSQGTRAF